MRRIKTYRGRRVLKTRRRGDDILVKLARDKPMGRPLWIMVTRKRYQIGRIYKRELHTRNRKLHGNQQFDDDFMT